VSYLCTLRRGNDLTSAVAGDVAEMLLENNTLTQLNVGYNKAGQVTKFGL